MKPSGDLRSRSPYWAYYTGSERQALSEAGQDDLTSDIHLIRIQAAGQLRALGGDLDLPLARLALHTFRHVASCQALLHRVHALVNASDPDLKRLVGAAYQLARQELGVLAYLSDPPFDSNSKELK